MSLNLNRVAIAGNLTKDPDLRHTGNGTAVCSFTVAVNRRYKVGTEVKEEVSFLRVTVWSEMGKNCEKYLSKGSGVLVEGHLKQERWEGEDGKMKDKTAIVAQRVHFLDKKKDNGQDAQQDAQPPF